MADNSVFITQGREKGISQENKKPSREDELHAIISGATQASQSTRLLKKKKEMREVDEALEIEKTQYQIRMESLRDRQTQLSDKQQTMRENVVKFERFIRENDTKRQRAEQKAIMEAKILKTKESEERRLLDTYQSLLQERSELLVELDELDIFKQYFERTVDLYPTDFEAVRDILNRYFVLITAHDDLRALTLSTESEMEMMASNLETLKLNTQNELLMGNSQVHQFQQQVEHLKSQFKQVSDENESTEERQKSVIREGGQVVMSIQNLYMRCASTMRIKQPIHSTTTTSSSSSSLSLSDPTNSTAVMDQLSSYLSLIHQRVSDLGEIHREWEGKKEREEEERRRREEMFDQELSSSSSLHQLSLHSTHSRPNTRSSSNNKKSNRPRSNTSRVRK